MEDYELVKTRLADREQDFSMSLEEAQNIFYGTTVFIYQSKDGKYGWTAIMGEDRDFDTPRSAVNDALSYLERGGY